MLRMQQSLGNQYVQRMRASQRTAAPATIQRCGDAACNCSTKTPLRGVLQHEVGVQAGIQQSIGNEISAKLRSQKGSGSPLDPGVRAKLEPAMGVGLGAVSIHTDASADMLARSVNAEAFTTGSDVYFRSGRYNPHSDEGMHLLAHELTHTVQQSAGHVSGAQLSPKVNISEPGDSLEQAADQNAAHVMRRLKATDSRADSERARSATIGDGPKPVVQAVQRSANDDGVRIQRKVFTDTTTAQMDCAI
jgi:Domain of unknown function (DUF4157)